MNEQELAKVRETLRGIITRDRELSDIQLGEFEPFIYYKKDSRDTVSQILNTPIKIERECPRCKDSGEVDFLSYLSKTPCPTCNGTGKQTIEFTLMGLVEKELEGER